MSTPQEVAWRDARRNYADVDELRAALMAMAPGKTGASMGLDEEQLHVLTKAEDHILAPWLVITGLFFAGEVPDELKLGVVSPLAKDEEKFRPSSCSSRCTRCARRRCRAATTPRATARPTAMCATVSVVSGACARNRTNFKFVMGQHPFLITRTRTPRSTPSY